MTKRTKIFFAAALALLYSIADMIVGPVIAERELKFDWHQILPFIVCLLLCFAINYFVFSVIPQLRLQKKDGDGTRRTDRIGNRVFFLIVWAFIFASWIPAYLILYPGILSYDMISQVNSAINGITNNHHPVLHTWLIRLFMKLGDSLFSGYEAGIGLLSLFQMILLSYALARLVFLLKKKKVPFPLVAATALLSAGWFTNACLSVTMVKDSLHAAFLVLFVCHFAEIAMDPSEYLLRKRNLFFFPVISFLMCAFRNNGIHIYIFCFAALLIMRLPQIKKAKTYIALIVVIVLPPFMYKIYTGPVFDAWGIAQTETREALSVPIQQLQYVAVKKGNELTDGQAERMKYYIDDLEWMDSKPCAYDPFCADFAKSCFYSEHYDEDPVAFWKFYLQLGRQFTKEYAVAFLSNTLGYWYPGFYRYSYVMYDNYAPGQFAVPLERKSIWDSKIIKSYYKSVCSSDFWRETPVLRLFFVPGFALWFLLYAMVLAWKKSGFFTKVMPLFLPMIAQYGIMILSPIASFRYSWPLYLMLPLAFLAIWGDTQPQTLNAECECASGGIRGGID